MEKAIAGFIPRKEGAGIIRAKADEQFNQLQENKRTLSDDELAKQVNREKTAQLKALRLAKEARLEAIHLAKKATKK